MVNIAPIIIATNAMTISNLARMRRNSSGYTPKRPKKTKSEKEKKVKEIPAFLKEKFDAAWEKQEKGIAGEKLILTDSWEYNNIREYGWTVGKKTYNYDNGKVALVEEWDDPHRSVTRYDKQGNCIEDSSGKYVYYPKSKQKEFELTEKGLKHFTKDGKDDTAELIVANKIEKVHKRMKEKGILPIEAPDTEPVTVVGKVLTSAAVRRARRLQEK